MADIATTNKIYIFFKQLFCRHDYIKVRDDKQDKWVRESERQLNNGEISSYCYSAQHKCSKCDKETYLSSGMIC
jgi:hypothetical protein